MKLNRSLFVMFFFLPFFKKMGIIWHKFFFPYPIKMQHCKCVDTLKQITVFAGL